MNHSKENPKDRSKLPEGMRPCSHIIELGNDMAYQRWAFASVADYALCHAWCRINKFPIRFARPYETCEPNTLDWWLPIVVTYGIWPRLEEK